MRTTIYISDEGIGFACGDASRNSIKVSSAGRVELDKGAISHGRIINKEEVLSKLAQIKQQLPNVGKGVDLLIDSDHVVNKLVDVPTLNQPKMLEIVKAELIEFLDGGKEYIYDFSAIPGSMIKNKSLKILCGAIERDLYEEYEQVMKESGIALNSFDFTISAQLFLTSFLSTLKEKTYILAVLDGHELNASLYVKGQMVYNNEFSIKERGNLGLITEINRVLSSFIQFNKAQKNETEVENIYMCGMSEMEEGLCTNLSTALGISTQVLESNDKVIANQKEFALAGHFFEIGNLLRDQI